MSALRRFADRLWGAGEYAVTIPSMDGALRPNSLLDSAVTLAHAEAVDNLACGSGAVYFTRGKELLRWRDGAEAYEVVSTMTSDISALACSKEGVLAIGLDAGGVFLRKENDEETREIARFAKAGEESATALAFDRDGLLHVCLGSQAYRASAWKRDLMSLGSSGSVWRVERDGSARCLGKGLAFPNGISFDASNLPIISEAWKHQLLRLTTQGTWQRVLGDLPAYPSRISHSQDGGYWLAMFAPRSQMIEFVLREPGYRKRMVETIDEQFWMAPDLRAGRDFREPLQGGGVKHLGIQKPWGPTRSYGLLVRLDRDFRPIASMHSRTDGVRHGVTSCVEVNDGNVIVACKGDGALIRL